MMEVGIRTVALAAAVACVGAGGGWAATGTAAADPPAAKAPSSATGEPSVLILKIAGKRLADAWQRDKEKWSIWRYYEVVETDVCRLEPPEGSTQAGSTNSPQAGSTNSPQAGELVRVNPIDSRQLKDKDGNWIDARIPGMGTELPGASYRVKPAPSVRSSPRPARDWMKPGFDDSDWARSNGRARFLYRGISTMCLRGRFQVDDPAGVDALDLDVDYQGGIAVYLNGQEVGRNHLPAGPLTPDTLATDYPKDAYFKPDGSCPSLYQWQNSEYLEYEGYRSDSFLTNRIRKIRVSIPPKVLKKGMNVLAFEVHRSPLAECAVTKNYKQKASLSVSWYWWNRCEVEALTLKAKARPGAIEANCSIPKGLRVWEQAPLSVDVLDLADACELPVRVKMLGLRNGVTHGQFMAGSDAPISKLDVHITDLSGSAGTIPKSAIQLGFPRFDGLEPEPPEEIAKENVAPNGWRTSVLLQPIWVTVQIPSDAAPGLYTGQMTVAAEGEKQVAIPVTVEVVGGWVLPESVKFKPYVALMESPDTLAATYDEPLWSDRHWAHVERVLQLMGEVGAKEIHIGLESETHNGNKDTIVLWKRQADPSTGSTGSPQAGSGQAAFAHDFSIADKYIGLAAKYLGTNVNVICAINYGQYSPVGYGYGEKKHPQYFSVVDPKTGALTNEVAPAWGTSEALAFWKPVFEGLHKILAKHNIATELAYESYQFDGGNPACEKDLWTMVPGIKLAGRSHWDHYSADQKKIRLYLSQVLGVGVFWDPGTDQPYYNWREPWTQISFGRDCYPMKDNGWGAMNDWKSPAAFYQYPERTMLTGMAGVKPDMRKCAARGGFGHWGADYWPVLIDGDKKPKCLINRYVQTTGLFVTHLFCPGKKGPIPSVRSEMLREGLQDFQARAFVQDALLDHADKLGPDLAKRCKAICDDRTRFHLRGSYFGYDGEATPYEVNALRLELYRVTDEVAKAMGR